MRALADPLRRTLTRDQGRETPEHAYFGMGTGIPVYSCDPHSPWQPAMSGNTDGLLRRYFPQRSGLSLHTGSITPSVPRSSTGPLLNRTVPEVRLPRVVPFSLTLGLVDALVLQLPTPPCRPTTCRQGQLRRSRATDAEYADGISTRTTAPAGALDPSIPPGGREQISGSGKARSYTTTSAFVRDVANRTS